MNATTTGHAREEADRPTWHDLEQAWAQFHADNLAAHNEGCCARGLDLPNPHHRDSDCWYWWREGYEGRPFAVLTDTEALLAYRTNLALRTVVPDDAERAAIIRQPRSRRKPNPKPPASSGPTAGKQHGPEDALGVVHPTD